MLQQDMKRKEYRVHPTQKPLPLIKRIIERHSDPNDLILDPFLGSGTTAVAAKQLGRRFIGIEISDEYCKIATQRLVDTGVTSKANRILAGSPLTFEDLG